LGAEIDQADKAGETALLKIARSGRNPEVLAELLQAGARTEKAAANGETPVIAAAQNPQPEMLRLLLDAGADIRKTDNNGFGALYACALANPNLEVHTELLRLGLNINEKGQDGMTPLMAAIVNPNPQVTRYYLIQGAELEAANRLGRTALLIAASLSGDPMVIKILLAAGADPLHRDLAGRNALDYAALNPARSILETFPESLRPKPAASSAPPAAPQPARPPAPSPEAPKTPAAGPAPK
ncbi:MAG: ankyrin repeat domain-containing protein, partial [Deltaproteobacteria bacterium]|nr:ankyrin repeat domain-containing protein [Deltaproteobacteria bacterium]